MRSFSWRMGLACVMLLAWAPGVWAKSDAATTRVARAVLATNAQGNLVTMTVVTATYKKDAELVSYHSTESVPALGTVINAGAVQNMKTMFLNHLRTPTALDTSRSEIGTVFTDEAGKKMVQVVTWVAGCAPVVTIKTLAEVAVYIPPPPTARSPLVTTVIVPQSGDGG